MRITCTVLLQLQPQSPQRVPRTPRWFEDITEMMVSERRAIAGARSGPSESLASSIIFRSLVSFLAVFVAVQFFFVWNFQSGDEYSERKENMQRGDHHVVKQADEAVIDVKALLHQAGIMVDDDVTLSRLPTPSQISSMYGSRPVILGAESCAAFRNAVRPEDRHVAPAGLFNTGTNNLATLLRRNCYIPEREGAVEDRWKSGMRFQVPWGKHNPVSWRFRNVAVEGGRGIVQKDVLPVVVIRDPISWMVSMCKHPYGAWLGRNCIEGGQLASSVDPVSVPFKPQNVTRYDSLLDLWHVWYTDWMAAASRSDNDGIPALFVRFEDLLFHPGVVVQSACDCVHGKRRDGLYLREETAKGEIGPHAGGSGFLDAIIKNGNATKRLGTLHGKEDRNHVTRDRFSDLLTRFHYFVEGFQ